MAHVFKDFPLITRCYVTATLMTTVACYLEIISPNDLCFNGTRILKEYQYWRLVTNFFYIREMDFEFVFHLFLLAQYLKLLEETSFRGRKGDLVYMLLFGGAHLTVSTLIGGVLPYVADSFVKNRFLSNSLIFMMIYVWSRQYPFYQMSILGFFTFPAAYFPWIILGLYTLCGPNGYADLLGMMAGHTYFYLDEILPLMTGHRPLKTPYFIKLLFPDDPVVAARPVNWRFAPPPAEEDQ